MIDIVLFDPETERTDMNTKREAPATFCTNPALTLHRRETTTASPNRITNANIWINCAMQEKEGSEHRLCAPRGREATHDETMSPVDAQFSTTGALVSDPIPGRVPKGPKE